MESPPIQLSTLYEDTSSTIPLVFVLSSGSDPMSSFLRFAKEKKLHGEVCKSYTCTTVSINSTTEFMLFHLVKDKVQ